jgi:hypothetical protein
VVYVGRRSCRPPDLPVTSLPDESDFASVPGRFLQRLAALIRRFSARHPRRAGGLAQAMLLARRDPWSHDEVRRDSVAEAMICESDLGDSERDQMRAAALVLLRVPWKHGAPERTLPSCHARSPLPDADAAAPFRPRRRVLRLVTGSRMILNVLES